MDSRAFRMPLPELAVFEVDMQTTFDVKEPLLDGEKLTVKSRAVVATEFADHGPYVIHLSAPQLLLYASKQYLSRHSIFHETWMPE